MDLMLLTVQSRRWRQIQLDNLPQQAYTGAEPLIILISLSHSSHGLAL